MSRVQDSNLLPKFGRLPCNHQHLFCIGATFWTCLEQEVICSCEPVWNVDSSNRTEGWYRVDSNHQRQALQACALPLELRHQIAVRKGFEPLYCSSNSSVLPLVNDLTILHFLLVRVVLTVPVWITGIEPVSTPFQGIAKPSQLNPHFGSGVSLILTTPEGITTNLECLGD